MDNMEEAPVVEGETVVRIGKRCYVGNLAWKTSWQDLKDKFRECGNVVYANVMRDEEGELESLVVRFVHTSMMAATLAARPRVSICITIRDI